MIQANELRVGNLIDYLGKIITVNTNTIHAVSRIVHPSVMYKPIPISPEILEKFGFVGVPPHTKDIFSYNGLSVILTAKRGNLVMWQIEGQEPVELNRITQYAHQLQNLYFALTGEELPYTP